MDTVSANIPESPDNVSVNPETKTQDISSAPESLVEDIVTDAAKPRPQIVEFDTEDTQVSEDEREAFLQSIITGSRYKVSTSIFGGRIPLTIRCRSIEETDAILVHLGHMLRSGKLQSAIEYSSYSRLALVCAQVEELNGVHYDTLACPLMATESDGKIVPPAWVNTLNDVWKKKPEALVMAVSDAIVEFEKHYWTMIREAKNKNFWNPGESTGA